MSAGRSRSVSEKRVAGAAHGLRPAVTMQPTIAGEAGEPVGVVIAEVVCADQEENDLFAGLGAFIRAELPTQKTATDIALEKLLGELCLKGRRLAADAILSTDIKLLRGTDAAGHRLLKMIATGTAVILPSRQDRSATS
jgi:uncharacterized protein YbjQ (UPF0145 family)